MYQFMNVHIVEEGTREIKVKGIKPGNMVEDGYSKLDYKLTNQIAYTIGYCFHIGCSV